MTSPVAPMSAWSPHRQTPGQAEQDFRSPGFEMRLVLYLWANLCDVEDVLFQRGNFAGELLLELAQQHRLVGFLCLRGWGKGVEGGFDGGEHSAVFAREGDWVVRHQPKEAVHKCCPVLSMHKTFNSTIQQKDILSMMARCKIIQMNNLPSGLWLCFQWCPEDQGCQQNQKKS